MAQTLFRGPVLQGKFNEAGLTGFNLENKSSNYTVVNGDSGKTFTSSTDGVVFTLPAISIGRVFTFVNTGTDGTNTLTISPNANDGILYAGSLTDNTGSLEFQSSFGTEGCDIFVPGSGIRFKNGVYLDLTNTTSVTIGYTG